MHFHNPFHSGRFFRYIETGISPGDRDICLDVAGICQQGGQSVKLPLTVGFRLECLSGFQLQENSGFFVCFNEVCRVFVTNTQSGQKRRQCVS